VIPKAREVIVLCQCSQDTGICLPCVGQVFAKTSSSSFHLYPGYKNTMEEKTYPAMDLPVYGESDGTNFILVED